MVVAEMEKVFEWPAKRDLFGVEVTPSTYDQVVDHVVKAAHAGARGVIDFMPVHGLVMAARDAKFRAVMNDFSMVNPDGQPVRWALNRFHKAHLTDRVYGPETMKRVCKAAADEGIPIYLYGGKPDVLEKLSAALMKQDPSLKIAGAESPPFRALTADEDAAVIRRINSSGAKIVFIGIGCPRQEYFAHAHRDSIEAVQMCVGAAFDFHAGEKKTAPGWMQRNSLEWLFRLTQEPGRLWKRYLVTNTLFMMLATRRMVVGR